jgi:hypothetical protein
MTAIVPIEAESIDGYDAPDRPWSQVQSCLDTDDGRVRRAWLSTTCPDGTPHTMPLSAIWFEGLLLQLRRPYPKKPELGRKPAQRTHVLRRRIRPGLPGNDQPNHRRAQYGPTAGGLPGRRLAGARTGRPVLRTVQRAERRAAAVEPVSDDRHNRFRSGCRGTVQRNALAVLNQGEQARGGSAIR